MDAICILGQIYARLRRGLQEGETARGTVGGSLALEAAGTCVVGFGLGLFLVCVCGEKKIGGGTNSSNERETTSDGWRAYVRMEDRCTFSKYLFVADWLLSIYHC